MRIDSAADSLLPTLDATASQNDTADKGLFASLLQAQPGSIQPTQEAAAALSSAAATPVLSAATLPTAPIKSVGSGAVLAEPAAPMLTPEEILAAKAANPQPHSLAALEPATTPALPAPEGDSQLTLAADATEREPVVSTAPATDGDVRVQLATRMVQASAVAASQESLTGAASMTMPATIARTVQPGAPAAKADEGPATNSAEAIESTPAIDTKTEQKPRPLRDTHTAAIAAAQHDSGAASAIAPDASTANAPAIMELASTAAPQPASVRNTADTITDCAPMNTCAQAASSNAMAVAIQSTAADQVSAMQAAPNDATLPEPLMVESAGASSARGAQLPHSGKDLPLTTKASDDTVESSQSPDQRLFKELADTALSLNPVPAGDTSALQTNQTLLNATSANPNTADATVQKSAAVSSRTQPNAASPGGSTTLISNSTATYVFTSGLAMQSSGWSEEAVQHIRWLKDHDQQSAEIQLHPAELGRMSISIDIKDGQASVQLLAGSAEAKDLLEQSLPQLRDLLAQSGMSLTDSGVTQHKNGQQTWPNRFNPSWFESEELKPVALSAGRPALFRSAGGSYRIDQYV